MFAFNFILILHAWGMGIIAGGNAAIDLRILGFAPRVPLSAMAKFYPVMWFGFWINLFTGFSIFLKDASIYGRNYDLYVKLVFVILGVALIKIMRKQVFGDPSLDNGPVSSRHKMLAWASLACWFCAIVAGRLIAYVGPVPGL